MAGDEGIIGRCVTIRRRVPSQNATHYAHWRSYSTERDAWFVLIRSVLPPRQPPETPIRMILRSYRTRLVDYANLVGGAKPIPDILVRLGYLRDDSPRWFFCDYQQFQVAKADERTEIEFIPWAGIEEDGDHG